MKKLTQWIEELDFQISLRLGVWKIKRGYRHYKCKQCGCRYRVLKEKKRNAVCPHCGNTTKHT